MKIALPARRHLLPPPNARSLTTLAWADGDLAVVEQELSHRMELMNDEQLLRFTYGSILIGSPLGLDLVASLDAAFDHADGREFREAGGARMGTKRSSRPHRRP